MHIGDGLVVGGYRPSTEKNTLRRLFFSVPENGEYANETYFITEGDWVKHLRISPMPRMDWVFCCSDGGGSIALINNDALKIGFLEPVVIDVFASNDEDSRNKKLAGYLSDPLTEKVTNDDKSILMAIRGGSKLDLTQYAPVPSPENPAPTSPADPHVSPTPATPIAGPQTDKTKGHKKRKFKYALIFAIAISSIILGIWAFQRVPSVAIQLMHTDSIKNTEGSVEPPGSPAQDEPGKNEKSDTEDAAEPSPVRPPVPKKNRT
jgi:hypothetical protein